MSGAFVLRCGHFYLGDAGRTRVTRADLARRLSREEAAVLLRELRPKRAPFPLPWRVEEVRNSVSDSGFRNRL